MRRGIELWKHGDVKGFGELMNASCQSSIENWEAGSPELIELQRTLEQTQGVYGSRFSGAGFGGCVVALVTVTDGKAALVVGVTDDLTDRLSAVELVRVGAEALGGTGGGGRPDMAQAGGPDGDKADAALDAIERAIAA